MPLKIPKKNIEIADNITTILPGKALDARQGKIIFDTLNVLHSIPGYSYQNWGVIYGLQNFAMSEFYIDFQMMNYVAVKYPDDNLYLQTTSTYISIPYSNPHKYDFVIAIENAFNYNMTISCSDFTGDMVIRNMYNLEVLTYQSNKVKSLTINVCPLINSIMFTDSLLEKIEIYNCFNLNYIDFAYCRLPEPEINKLFKFVFEKLSPEGYLSVEGNTNAHFSTFTPETVYYYNKLINEKYWTVIVNNE